MKRFVAILVAILVAICFFAGHAHASTCQPFAKVRSANKSAYLKYVPRDGQRCWYVAKKTRARHLAAERGHQTRKGVVDGPTFVSVSYDTLSTHERMPVDVLRKGRPVFSPVELRRVFERFSLAPSDKDVEFESQPAVLTFSPQITHFLVGWFVNPVRCDDGDPSWQQ